MKKIKHWGIYIAGIAVSITLMGMTFIPRLPTLWQNIFCGIGASGIGAIVLAAVIELQDETRQMKQNKAIFQAVCSGIQDTIYRLLIVLYRIIKDINAIIEVDQIEFEDIKIEQLIDIYKNALIVINSKTAPILSTDEIIPHAVNQAWGERRNAQKIIQSCNKEIDTFRELFNQQEANFEWTKAVLLTNQIKDEITVEKLHQILLILSDKGLVYNESAFSRAINALKEIIDCGLADVLNEIGFENRKFNSRKGYLM